MKTLKRITNDSFVASFLYVNSYSSSGLLITYNLTTFKITAEIKTSNFPGDITVLNQTNMIYQYYFGLNEQIIKIPNLTITNNITLDSQLANPIAIATNNDTSYYILTPTNGLFFLKNITNSLPAFNFGQNLSIS